MGSLRLRPASTVEYSQATDRACVLVCPFHSRGKHSITKRSIRYLFYKWAISKQLVVVRRSLAKDPNTLGVACLRFEACR